LIDDIQSIVSIYNLPLILPSSFLFLISLHSQSSLSLKQGVLAGKIFVTQVFFLLGCEVEWVTQESELLTTQGKALFTPLVAIEGVVNVYEGKPLLLAIVK
jgi:hypothetical protein